MVPLAGFGMDNVGTDTLPTPAILHTPQFHAILIHTQYLCLFVPNDMRKLTRCQVIKFATRVLLIGRSGVVIPTLKLLPVTLSSKGAVLRVAPRVLT